MDESRADRWYARPLAVALPVAATLLLALPSLGHPLVDLDDVRTIRSVPLLRHLDLATLPRFFVPEVRDGLREYMPLKDLSFAVDYALVGDSDAAFRPQQLLFAALGTAAVFAWCRRLVARLVADGRLPPWASAFPLLVALGFAVHPIRVETVGWLSGRKDLLEGTFLFAALALAVPHANSPRRWGRELAILACFVLALLSKPIAVTFPLLLALQSFVLDGTRGLRRALPTLVASAALVCTFVFLYVQVTGGVATDVRAEAAARVFHGAPYVRWGQQLVVFARLFVTPDLLAPLLPSTLMDPSPVGARAIAGYAAALASVGATLAVVRRRHLAAFGAVFAVLSVGPVLAAPPWAQYYAGRYLAVGTAGLFFTIVVLGGVLVATRPRLVLPLIAGYGVWLASLAAEYVAYDASFASSSALYLEAAARHPGSAELHRLAGTAALREGRGDVAVSEFSTCLRLVPTEATCAAGLAQVIGDRDPARAVALLVQALPTDHDGSAHLRLARLRAANGQAAEGARLYKGWLATHRVSPAQVFPMIDLALRADDPALALRAAVKWTQVRTLEDPGGVPDPTPFAAIAARLGRPSIDRTAREAAARCRRNDCFARALGISLDVR